MPGWYGRLAREHAQDARATLKLQYYSGWTELVSSNFFSRYRN